MREPPIDSFLEVAYKRVANNHRRHPLAHRKKSSAQKSAPSKAPVEAKPLTARSRDLLKGPPGILGYAHLITPDEAFGQTKFKANIHYEAKPLAALIERCNEAYWALVPDIQAMATDAKKKVKILSKAEVAGWFQEKLKEPSESARIQVPYLIFDTNASYRGKNGEEVPVTIKAFDPHGAPVDLKGMRLGMESIVQPIFTVGVWAGPLSKWVVLPKLRLVGLQVLKLKTFGSGEGRSSVGEVTDADLAYLDENFSADDLSQFVSKDAPAAGKKEAQAVDPEMDDEIQF